VWFGELAFDDRMVALIDEILVVAPCVVGLQEVTPRFAAALRGSAVVTALYDVSTNDVGPYGCLMLARSDFGARFREVPIPTKMGRSLLLCDCPPMESLAREGTGHSRGRGRPAVTVATVHLESLNQAPQRLQQLKVCEAELSRCRGGACLIGDFNFDATREWGEWRRPAPAAILSARRCLENDAMRQTLPDYVDCWPAVHGAPLAPSAGPGASDGAHVPRQDTEPYLDPESALGFTFDGLTNAGCCADPKERMRYDRVLCRGGGGGGGGGGILAFGRKALRQWMGTAPPAELRPLGIALLGRDPIRTPLARGFYNGVEVKASDHYGLSARLQFSEHGGQLLA
jgi:endonuclease/exonuclease/phosphatase family metal-dependent hydrolase